MSSILRFYSFKLSAIRLPIGQRKMVLARNSIELNIAMKMVFLLVSLFVLNL